MSRNEEYQFIPTDAAEVERYLTELYEGLCKIKVRQATPEWLYIKWVTEIIIQERVLNNYTGNQNIPSRAAGENLDALAELVLEQKRPGGKTLWLYGALLYFGTAADGNFDPGRDARHRYENQAGMGNGSRCICGCG